MEVIRYETKGVLFEREEGESLEAFNDRLQAFCDDATGEGWHLNTDARCEPIYTNGGVFYAWYAVVGMVREVQDEPETPEHQA